MFSYVIWRGGGEREELEKSYVWFKYTFESTESTSGPWRIICFNYTWYRMRGEVLQILMFSYVQGGRSRKSQNLTLRNQWMVSERAENRTSGPRQLRSGVAFESCVRTLNSLLTIGHQVGAHFPFLCYCIRTPLGSPGVVAPMLVNNSILVIHLIKIFILITN